MILTNVYVTFKLFERQELSRGRFEDIELESFSTKVRWDDNVNQYNPSFQSKPIDDLELQWAWISTKSNDPLEKKRFTIVKFESFESGEESKTALLQYCVQVYPEFLSNLIDIIDRCRI